MLLYCFVSQIRKLNLAGICSPYKGILIVKTPGFYEYKSNFSKSFEISVTACLPRRLSAASASVLLQPAPAHAPPPFPLSEGGGGAVILSIGTREPKKNLTQHVLCLWTLCNV